MIEKDVQMKNILIINGSIRKKTTYSLLKRLEPLLDQCKVEFLNIGDYNIKPCIGCENCILKGACHIKDDANLILEKLKRADGIILSSPVYLRQISGYVKLLIDRGCSWYHRSPLVGKPIFFVSTTQASGTKATIKYFNDLSVQWGTINTGSLSRNLFNLDKKIADNLLYRFIFFLEDNNKYKYKPSLKQIIEFNTQKVLAINVIPLDKKHWIKHQYVNQPYYYKCNINILKRIVGSIYFKILSHFIGKNKG